MSNAMSQKARIRNIAKQKNILIQVIIFLFGKMFRKILNIR